MTWCCPAREVTGHLGVWPLVPPLCVCINMYLARGRRGCQPRGCSHSLQPRLVMSALQASGAARLPSGCSRSLQPRLVKSALQASAVERLRVGAHGGLVLFCVSAD